MMTLRQAKDIIRLPEDIAPMSTLEEAMIEVIKDLQLRVQVLEQGDKVRK